MNRQTLPLQSPEDNELVRVVIPLGFIILTFATIIIIVLYHERESASCSRFLRRILKVRSRETNGEYVYDRHIDPIIQIIEEGPRQIVIPFQQQREPLLAEANNDLCIHVHVSDVEDLEKYGVLIFISDDKIGVGQRMLFIADGGKFGQPQYEHSLMLWEPVEDVKLHLFRQPIETPLWSLTANHINDMFKRVTESPKTYFVLFFYNR